MSETKMTKRDKLILSAFLPALALGLYWHISARPLARETRSLRETMSALGGEELLAARKENLKTQAAGLKEKLAETTAREQTTQQPQEPAAAEPPTDAPALKRVQDLFRDAGMFLMEASADSATAASDPIRADIAATLIKSGVTAPQRWRARARGTYASALRALASTDATIIVESVSFAPAGATNDGSREWTFSFFL